MSIDGDVVLLHGFTQTTKTWDHVIPHLPKGPRYLAPDLPGHNGAPSATSLEAAAELLASANERAVFIGYSMGGRIALRIAVARPEVVAGLVLVGATPGIESDAERMDRRAADDAIAQRIEQFGVAPFLKDWLAQPMFAGLPNLGWEERLRNTPAGLVRALRTMGTGTMEPLWERLGEVSCPVLVIVGERDEKFRAIGERMSTMIAGCQLLIIEGAGHAAHLQRPGVFGRAVEMFLRSIASSS